MLAFQRKYTEGFASPANLFSILSFHFIERLHKDLSFFKFMNFYFLEKFDKNKNRPFATLVVIKK